MHLSAGVRLAEDVLLSEEAMRRQDRHIEDDWQAPQELLQELRVRRLAHKIARLDCQQSAADISGQDGTVNAAPAVADSKLIGTAYLNKWNGSRCLAAEHGLSFYHQGSSNTTGMPTNKWNGSHCLAAKHGLPFYHHGG